MTIDESGEGASMMSNKDKKEDENNEVDNENE